ncbi:hypothetical protein ANCCAN_28720 [Ancylostoma caninum]|uniref:Uncharacterized protein n=1 Tax=Ancylostoma caninum TaxID=29170 RepID=A0A368F5V1_ANCCA|nr:hypothetical protein ANCCAN_28720 [Ancylostoma caninum]
MLSAYLVKEGTTFVTVTTGTRAMEGRAFRTSNPRTTHCWYLEEWLYSNEE